MATPLGRATRRAGVDATPDTDELIANAYLLTRRGERLVVVPAGTLSFVGTWTVSVTDVGLKDGRTTRVFTLGVVLADPSGVAGVG